jgi:hypothetical protein
MNLATLEFTNLLECIAINVTEDRLGDQCRLGNLHIHVYSVEYSKEDSGYETHIT